MHQPTKLRLFFVEMLSRINAELVIEKMIALSKEMNTPVDENMGILRLKTTKVVLEAMEDQLMVGELTEKLIGLWFPYLSSSPSSHSSWLVTGAKVFGIILESGYYDDDIWSESDAEEES